MIPGKLRAFIGLLVTGLVAGCGPGDGAEEAASQRRFLSIGTAPPGGAFFVVGGALSDVLQQNQSAAGWQVTAEATKGTQENIRRLSAGELDFALANAAISYFAVRGEGNWEATQPIQAVMTLAPNIALFIAPKDGDIAEIGDLKGNRVVVGPAGAGFEYFVGPILGAHGVTYEDFTPLHNTQAGAVDMLADGSAAAAFLGGAVPTASITQASTTQDVLFVPYAEEAMDSLVAEYPFFDKVAVPADTYRGQVQPFSGMNVGSMHLITSSAADEDLVYEVTRTIWENREQVIKKHPAGRAIQPQIAVRDTGVEFHPGAIRFYREIGIWSED